MTVKTVSALRDERSVGVLIEVDGVYVYVDTDIQNGIVHYAVQRGECFIEGVEPIIEVAEFL